MVDDCLFCKIAGGEIPAKVLYRDDEVVAFEDVNPQGAVPRAGRPLPAHLDPERRGGRRRRPARPARPCEAARIAAEQGHAEDGYRTVFNCNRGAGQTVFHIHLHLLAGRNMTWPPG